ncbi:RNA-binding domain-containing protein [Cutaneotrichosporon oleaginosum]|uniref:RNA-binding domain-containing protein n=1 Tax=Cutaneotrichosporon oleaginosum TaxID=879819 RepID=A0A0J1B2M7_9TREE|nr:RNA-binding domain-containing protein [Cutaneotrichosporon oleaginosum]KLT41849.1 RNA-binding domain-containing protein [Cutaneotrichosporon oleaginosum]TXT14769.1 hypothetical protein COLE_00962 [Cutaneotrichosporon oleaginosum]
MTFHGSYDDVRMIPEPRSSWARSERTPPRRVPRHDAYLETSLTRRSGPPPRPANAPRPEANNVLGVFGLSIRTRERDLEDEFMRFGDVEKVTIVYDQRTDRSRGFGFITMRSTEDATRAIEKLNGIELHGRNIRVDYSATTKPHAPTPGEYRGEKRPLDDRWGGGGGGGRERGGWGRGGDRYGDRWGPGSDRYDDRRGGGGYRDRPYDRPFGRDRDRDGPYGRGGRDRDDDPYGGRARRDEDRERPPFAGGEDRDRERRRSPSPRRRYSASPERRAPPPPADDAPIRY